MADKHKKDSKNLVWIDLEMTGLDPNKDHIIEIATIITTPELEIIAEGPQFVINRPESDFEGMDDWNQTHHTKSGLWKKVIASEVSVEQAEEETLKFIGKFLPKGKGILAGNSIWQDRRFIINHMKKIDRFLHYRMLDVSAIKIAGTLWYKDVNFEKKNTHRALDDIRESIEELKFLRGKIFKEKESQP